MRNNEEEDFYLDDEDKLMHEFRINSCKEGLLKIENDTLICEKSSHIFIDRPNVVRINNFDGRKVARKLLYYRCPYKDHYNQRTINCDLYYKILPNSNLESNLNLLREYFGDKTFIYIFEDFGYFDDFLDETSVNIYLSALLKSLKKGSKAFNSYTIEALTKVLGRFFEHIMVKLERLKDFSEQDDFVVKSILRFFIFLKDVDVFYIDMIIKAFFLRFKRVMMTDIDLLTDYAENIERYPFSVEYTNQEIKEFLIWLRKRITGGEQKQNIQISFTVIVLGPFGGGKSAVCNYIMTNTYIESPGDPYKGVDFILKIVNLTYHDVKLKLSLLDYNKDQVVFSNSSIQNISGIILVFDISDGTHLDQVLLWLKELEKIKKVPIIIAANKIDLGKHKEVSEEWITNLKKSFHILDYIECSAKTGQNINALFQTLCVKIVEIG